MKTLLVGGPHDGEVIQTRRNDFAMGFVEEVFKRTDGGERLLRSVEEKYVNAYEPISHPCKKRGKVRVFKYAGQMTR